jgi:hypothetical protein
MRDLELLKTVGGRLRASESSTAEMVCRDILTPEGGRTLAKLARRDATVASTAGARRRSRDQPWPDAKLDHRPGPSSASTPGELALEEMRLFSR